MLEMCEPRESFGSSSSRPGDRNASSPTFSTSPIDDQLSPSDVKASNSNPDQMAANSPPYVNFSLLPCKVCGVSSSGYHYGIISCEGCKGFFARSMRRARASGMPGCSAKPYQHRCSGIPESNNCKQCRYEKCLLAGMSLLAVQIGRHSLQRREQTRMEVSRLAQHNQLLNGKIFRRRLFNRIGVNLPSNDMINQDEQLSSEQEISNGFRKQNSDMNKMPGPSKSESNIPVDLTNFCVGGGNNSPDVNTQQDYSKLMGQILQNNPNFGLIPPQNVGPDCSSGFIFTDPRNLFLLANSGNSFLVAQLAALAASSCNTSNGHQQLSNNKAATSSSAANLLLSSYKQQQEQHSPPSHDNSSSSNNSSCRKSPAATSAVTMSDEFNAGRTSSNNFMSTPLAVGVATSNNEDNDKTNANLAAMFTQFTDLELSFLCALICFNFNSTHDDNLTMNNIIRNISPNNPNNNNNNSSSSVEHAVIDSPLISNADAAYWSVVEIFVRKMFPDNQAINQARFDTFRNLVNYFRKTARNSGWTVTEFADRFTTLLNSGRGLLKAQSAP